MKLQDLIDQVYVRINVPRTTAQKRISKLLIEETLKQAIDIIAEELEQGGDFTTPVLGKLHVRMHGKSRIKALGIQTSQGMKARLKSSPAKHE